MIQAELSLEWEICPSCGSSAFLLNEETGWCANCTTIGSTANCRKCGKINDQVSGWLCSQCKLNNFLERNADRIEHHLNSGLSLTQTLHRVRDEVRPICVVCQMAIPHAKRGAVFCRRNSICKTYSRRYVYLYTEKGLTKAEALAAILSAL